MLKVCCRVLCLVLVAFFLFSLCFCIVPYGFAGVDQATSVLHTANLAVGQAFGAVLDAEDAGANVTVLLSRLNGAVALLAQAEIAYRIGDADSVAVKANDALSVASEVKAAAFEAKQAALVSRQTALQSSIVLSVVGGVVFVLVLVFVWRLLKKRYIKRLYAATPEVAGL